MDNPNNPVIIGKMMSSVGCKTSKRHIVSRQAIIFARMEKTAHRTIGKVEKGLIIYPMPGRNPPADWKIAVNALRKAAMATRSVLPVFSRIYPYTTVRSSVTGFNQLSYTGPPYTG